MSRDKQIEEMAELLRSSCAETNEDDCEKIGGDCGICDATRLYNAGYRKASDVAEEIFAEIERICIDTFGNFNHRVFAELKKKYTEEGK